MAAPTSVSIRKSEATRNAILDATGALIAEKGVDGFTISDVGQRAQVNRALVYHYFKNRDNLVDEAIDHIMGTHDPIDEYITPESVAALARKRIENPETSRIFFQMLLGERPMPVIGGKIKYAVGRLMALQQERDPTETYDPAFGLLTLTLVQHAWPFARDAFARLMELDPETADERYVDFLRWATELVLEATGRPSAPKDDE